VGPVHLPRKLNGGAIKKMKTSFTLTVLTILVVVAVLFSSFANTGGNSKQERMQTIRTIPEKGGKGFAVLELFTSEGCSSCPPADALLARLQKESDGKAVYILAYHVDYWDRLGWKDAYSNADFSKRQFQYGDWLHLSPIYTPQLIVNGETQYLGSDETAIRHAIAEQLAGNPSENLVLRALPEGDKFRVEYQVTPVAKGSRVLIVLIQKTAESKVERGENAGLLLSHVQIVRKLQTASLDADGNGVLKMDLPKGFNMQQGEIIGLVQDQRSGEILAAARVGLNQ
jgi:hypothetical protein